MSGGGNINRSASSSSSSSMSSISKHSSNVPPSSSSPICNDDLSNEDDEVRVYGDEGAVEEEKRCSNTLIEDKIDLCKNSEVSTAHCQLDQRWPRIVTLFVWTGKAGVQFSTALLGQQSHDGQ